jgi:hypothetical protein
VLIGGETSLNKKKRQTGKSHILRYIGIGLVAIALVIYFGNTIFTALSMLSSTPGEGGGGGGSSGGAAAISFTTRELLILGLLIVGVLLVIFG